MKIREVVLRVIREDEEGAITDANSVTADTYSLAYSSQIENFNAVVTSEKLEKSDDLVDAAKNMTINNNGYELNAVHDGIIPRI